jgi:putative tryptophan/tyrosine transport system substrate-binding protein
MRHHRLISLILTAILAFSLPSRAQDRATPVVGFLTSGSIRSLNKDWLAAFRHGLGESGYVDGENVKIDFRGADDQYDRLDGLAAEFVRNQVAAIVAAGGPVSALAAKRVTKTIPIVFTTISDPVKSGLVDGLAHPGGNATGTAGLTSELDRKRLELISQIKPSARVVGVLVNPRRPGVDANLRDIRDAAELLGVQVIFQNAGPEDPLDAAFERFAERRVDALVVTADPFFNFRRAQVIALATRYAMPAIYQWREFVADGGLMSYGPSITDAYHQTGVYIGRILKGTRPEDLPVMVPTRFELVINRRTAKSLGIEVPSVMLTRADDVIE